MLGIVYKQQIKPPYPPTPKEKKIFCRIREIVFLSVFTQLNIVGVWADRVQSAHNFLCSLRGVSCNQGRTGRDGAIVSCWSWAHPGPVWALMKRGMSRWDSLLAFPPVT